MDKIVIKGQRMRTKELAHQELKRAFGFPDYYGANLDALYDLLSECHEAQVCFYNSHAMLKYLGNYGVRILACLADVAEEHPDFLLEFK